MNFNKSIVFQNIYKLAQEKGIKISDLEHAAGVSKGYIARTSRDTNTSIPSIDFIVAVADKLGVSVDYLITVDTESLDENERYISSFLDTIEKNTLSGEIEWERDSAEGPDVPPVVEGPLFEEFDETVPSGSDYPDIVTVRRYASSFHDEGICDLRGDVVKARFLERGIADDISGAYIYIAPTEHSMMYGDEEQVDHEYELYVFDIGSNGAVREKSPLCCTGLLSQSIEDQVETIYKMALENSTHTRIDKKAKALIDRYMDLKNLPF